MNANIGSIVDVRVKPLQSALGFIAIGLLLYAMLDTAAELLLYRTGRTNPIYKIDTLAAPSVDWVILGASHAMPLDFDDVNAQLERDTGRSVINLASPGAGPLYNRFVFEHFLHTHRARRLLYVVDSFAFEAKNWNEDRFADAKMLASTPMSVDVAQRLYGYVHREGVTPGALANYLTGFSKINNRARFERDVWEGELQFDRSYRPSASATQKRIAYLYPQPLDAAVRARYLQAFARLVELAQEQGLQVTVTKLPLPRAFRARLPDEEAFNAALNGVLQAHGLALQDYSATLDADTDFFDTDHMGRTGVLAFEQQTLRDLLTAEHAP